MPKPVITKQTRALFNALTEQGIKAELEYWDGYKHVDIAVIDAKIYIEIDGLHHFTDTKQIEADFKRNHFSDGDDFDTIHIPNSVIDNYLPKVTTAIIKVIKKRQK